MRSLLNERLHHFLQRFSIDLLVAENVLAIPMHLPLGLALTEVIAESQIPAIAHHHDFFWERTRFSVNAVGDYLRMAFPAGLPNVRHVVINSDAREQLALRTGISSIIVPNVLDFENPPASNHVRSDRFRRSIGIEPGELLMLQPTRVIRRKGIEHAIELAKELRHLDCKLVISHEAGDEGFEYLEWLKEYAFGRQVDLRLVSTRVQDPWQSGDAGEAPPCLWDVYPVADFITYPSLYEGFGNAFLEAVYFMKPMLINRYATFVRDIEPLGFDLTVMDGFLSRKTVQEVEDILRTPARRRQMVETNYEIAAQHFSYKVLREHLENLMRSFSSVNRDRLNDKLSTAFQPRSRFQKSLATVSWPLPEAGGAMDGLPEVGRNPRSRAIRSSRGG
jgi:glycosyltransferase involved in cell wall biosynthesis